MKMFDLSTHDAIKLLTRDTPLPLIERLSIF
jgi:hypothetical protein